MPTYLRSRFMIVPAIICVSLSACATVDVTAIGSPETDTIVSEAVEPQGNVITRTVTRLYQVFVDKGWHEEKSRERVQSAANILLNGIQTSETNEAVFTNASVSSDVLIDDIKTARYHIVQTTKAAEVYLDIASADADLTPELKQLQQALRLSEEAQSNFVENKTNASAVNVELTGLMVDVDNLRRVTDNFGDVVRTRKLVALADTST